MEAANGKMEGEEYRDAMDDGWAVDGELSLSLSEGGRPEPRAGNGSSTGSARGKPQCERARGQLVMSGICGLGGEKVVVC